MYVNYCSQCSFTICNDCVSEIVLTDNMYRCPQCRYIPPHIVSKDPHLVKPRLVNLNQSPRRSYLFV